MEQERGFWNQESGIAFGGRGEQFYWGREMSIAFKEWAIICEALGTGEQAIILRKGGIHEGREGFSFKHPKFYLFPTLFHEQIERTRLPPTTPIPAGLVGEIQIGQFARVEWTATITKLETALALAPYHLWNEDVVRERFHYDEAPGLHMAFLRVYRCEPPWGFADEAKYGGCRSWVEIPEAPEGMALAPVLSEQEHRRISGDVSKALARSA
jgi:hypothetical protein